MALESTPPLTEMSTRNLPWGKGRPAHEADNLTAICEMIVWKMGAPRRLTTLWAFMACYRDSFTFFFFLLSVADLSRNLRYPDREPRWVPPELCCYSSLLGRMSEREGQIIPV
jgi:hypothetical protein